MPQKGFTSIEPGSFIKSSKSMIFRLLDFKTAAFWRIVVYFVLQLSYVGGKMLR